MKILSFTEPDMTIYGHQTSCRVFCIHVKVTDINVCAEEMIEVVSNTSWIDKLEDVVSRAAFKARAKPTIDKLVNNIFRKVTDNVTKEFGEYMISHSAQSALEIKSHTKFPLPELFKDKTSGNVGFDFHTESNSPHIIFGEAKYCSSSTPRKKALEQIITFIEKEKDIAELDYLKNFAKNRISCEKAVLGKKGYVAAFSLNAKNPTEIFENALKSDEVKNLLVHQELYLIGIES